MILDTAGVVLQFYKGRSHPIKWGHVTCLLANQRLEIPMCAAHLKKKKAELLEEQALNISMMMSVSPVLVRENQA